MAIKAKKEITAKKLTATILKLIRDAGVPVSESQLPLFVKRELGFDVSSEAVIGASIALRMDGRLINAGQYRGSAMLALAW